MEEALGGQKLLPEELGIRPYWRNDGGCRRGSVQNQFGAADQRQEAGHAYFVDIPGCAALVRSEELCLDVESLATCDCPEIGTCANRASAAVSSSSVV